MTTGRINQVAPERGALPCDATSRRHLRHILLKRPPGGAATWGSAARSRLVPSTGAPPAVSPAARVTPAAGADASAVATTGSVAVSSLTGALASGGGPLAADDAVAAASFHDAFVDGALQTTTASRQVSA